MSANALPEMSQRIPLRVIAFTEVMLAVDSAYSQFVLAPVPGLPGIAE